VTWQTSFYFQLSADVYSFGVFPKNNRWSFSQASGANNCIGIVMPGNNSGLCTVSGGSLKARRIDGQDTKGNEDQIENPVSIYFEPFNERV